MKLTLLFLAGFTLSAGLMPLAAQTPEPTTPVTPAFTPSTLTALETIDLQKIREYYVQGDYETALSLCQNAIFENPNNWKAYVQLALCFHVLGKEDKALLAAKKARELHPGDPATEQLVESFQNETPFTPTPEAVTASTPAATPVSSPKKNSHYSLTLKVGTLLDYANLNNLDESAALWNASLMEAGYTGFGSFSHLGFGGTAELAWGLGQSSAIALRMSYLGGHGFTESYIYNGQSESQQIDPQLFTVGLDLYQYFPESFGRFFVCVGGLLGQAVVQADSTSPSYTIGGTLGGSALGGELGLGNEFTVGPDASLEVSLRYLALVVEQVETSYTDNYGNTGELALAQNSGGAVYLADTRSISGSVSYAPLDFSGILLGFSFNWRLL